MIDAAILMADGFEEIEALSTVDILRRAKIKCDMISMGDIKITGSHNITVMADKLFNFDEMKTYGCLILPGGMPGAKNLMESPQVIKLVQLFKKENKLIAAICAAPIVLNRAQVISDCEVTSYPSFETELEPKKYNNEIVVYDSNIITSRGPATAEYFALKLVEVISSKEAAKILREALLLEFVEGKYRS